MKSLLYCLFALLFLTGVSVSVHSQVSQKQPFEVLHIPRNLKYSEEKLNLEITGLKDKESIRQVLRSKNFSAGDIIIMIRKPQSRLAWWTINTGTWIEWEDDRIILQSRGSTQAEVNRLADFKTIFKDTVILLDTFSVGLYIHDPNYPDEAYVINFKCSNEWNGKKPIPVVNEKLLFTNGLFSGCDTLLFPITITNSGNPDRVLARCTLGFLTEDQREALLALGRAYYNDETTNERDNVAIFLADYFQRGHGGTINFPQLVNWLNTNLKP